MIIYKAQNKINGKIYIGQTIRSLDCRIEGHLRNKSYFSNALNKYGLQSFEFSVIDSTLLKEIADEKEKYWINFFNCKYPNGYNLTTGGQGHLGQKHTKEAKEKMSMAKKGINHPCYGKPLPDKTKKKISEALKGKQFRLGKKASQETKINLSKSKIGIKNPFYGKPLSEEHKLKISQSLKGRVMSLETRRKMGRAQKGKIYSAETRKKISEAHKLRHTKI